MKRFITIIIGLVLICSLVGCGKNTNNSTEPSNPTTQEPSTDTTIPSDTTPENTTTEDDTMNKTLTLKIGNTEVEVSWLDNDSVKALKQLAKNGLSIDLEMYGGMEQFGSLGSTLPSSDTNLTATAGDIMLYQSNKIVLFYGSNSWSYTKLGHINLSNSELTELLGEENVTITLTLK